MFKSLIFILFILSFAVHAVEYEKDEDTAIFSGRISRINNLAKLMRIKIRFENSKFLIYDRAS